MKRRSFFGAVGAAIAELCGANWSQYLEGELTPLQSADSIHVRFINHERILECPSDDEEWTA